MKTLNKLFTRNSTTISFMGIMCVALLISSCGGGVVKKEKANDWVEMGQCSYSVKATGKTVYMQEKHAF